MTDPSDEDFSTQTEIRLWLTVSTPKSPQLKMKTLCRSSFHIRTQKNRPVSHRDRFFPEIWRSDDKGLDTHFPSSPRAGKARWTGWRNSETPPATSASLGRGRASWDCGGLGGGGRGWSDQVGLALMLDSCSILSSRGETEEEIIC